VTYLVDSRRARLVSLESLDSGLIRLVVDQHLAGLRSLLLDLCLPVDEIDLEALRICNGDDVPATGGVGHLFDPVREHGGALYFLDLLKLLLGLDLESTTQEFLGSLSGVVDVLIWTVAAEPSLVLALLYDVHAEI
jgi:hypothetical protein